MKYREEIEKTIEILPENIGAFLSTGLRCVEAGENGLAYIRFIGAIEMIINPILKESKVTFGRKINELSKDKKYADLAGEMLDMEIVNTRNSIVHEVISEENKKKDLESLCSYLFGKGKLIELYNRVEKNR